MNSSPQNSDPSAELRPQFNQSQLGIFAKYWQPGNVKTRLAATFGAQVAADLYHQMLLTLLKRISSVETDSCSFDTTLYYSPPDRREAFEALPGNCRLQPQPAGDLGHRSAHFFETAFHRLKRSQVPNVDSGGTEVKPKIMIVGSDCPHLPLGMVHQAFERLEDVPMVIGPATDGGYYLLGLTEPADYLFSEISWSTSEVLEETLKQADRRKLKYEILDSNFDLDEAEDLLEFENQFREAADTPLATLAETCRELRLMKSGTPEH